MKPKDWITRRTKKRALEAYQGTQLNSNQETSPWFLGKINADRTKITDYFGNEYNLKYTGNPRTYELALRISQDTAIVNAAEIQFYQVDSSPSLGMVLGRDTTYLYIRYLGQTTKYYLPITDVLSGKDFNSFLGNLSSNGKGVLLGTVEIRTTDNHQIAYYSAFTDFQLVPYDDSFTANYSYPITKGDDSYVVLPGSVIQNSVDLNANINGFVPFPEPQTPEASGIWYPFASVGSLFSGYTPLQNVILDADSGIVDAEGFYGVPSREHVVAQGNEDLTWSASPNYARLNNYIFTFNNTTDGQYKADIIFTAVNAYLVGLTVYDAQNAFSDTFYNDLNDPPRQYPFNLVRDYSETAHAEYNYLYTENFAYNLRYLESLDLWITEDPVQTVQFNKSWLKDLHYEQNSTDPASGSSFQGSAQFDALTNTYLFRDPNNYFFNACIWAYVSTFVDFPFNPIGYGFYVVDQRIRTYWNTAVGTTDPWITGASDYWPGFYINYPEGSPTYNYMDLNYDNEFIGPEASQYDCVFAGRTTGVITDLLTSPALYGLTTYQMGDGNDNNEVQPKAFRGRAPNATAFCYKTTVNGVIRYSSPFLVPGNLTNIGGAGSVSIEAQQADTYVNGVVQLIPLRSFADVYDNQVLVSQIDSAINAYWNKTIPSPSLMNSIYSGLLALTTDLQASINQVKSALANIDGFLSGDSTILGPDVVGFDNPDVFSDKIFSASGTWPFAVPGTYYLKCPDSYIVQQLYYSGNNEIIQSFNVASDGATTIGKASTAPITNGMDYSVLDFILPIKEEDTQG